MCEFKVLRNKDHDQLAEDVVIVNYTENNELILKDIMGMGTKLDSALILSVNTMNQTLIVQEDPLIHQFLTLITKKAGGTLNSEDITAMQASLEQLKAKCS